MTEEIYRLWWDAQRQEWYAIIRVKTAQGWGYTLKNDSQNFVIEKREVKS